MTLEVDGRGRMINNARTPSSLLSAILHSQLAPPSAGIFFGVYWGA